MNPRRSVAPASVTCSSAALFAAVELSPSRAPLARSAFSSSQRAGLYYERRVLAYLEQRFLVLPQLPFRVGVSSSPSVTRRPDALLVHPSASACVVVEVKHQHTPEARWQLEQYVSIVRSAFPWMRVTGLEITKCWQPDLRIRPEFVTLGEVWDLRAYAHYVCILSDRELRLGLTREARLGGCRSGLVVGEQSSGALVW